MKKNTTSLVIDLSDLDSGLYANMESFPIDFYRCINNIHEVSVGNQNRALLLDFLTFNNIPFKESTRANLNWSFVEIFVKSDVYLSPNHHIELRVREILNQQNQ